MKLGQKIVYFLSLVALPLGAYGCKKVPLPENDEYTNTPDTTINIQPNQPDLPPTNEPNLNSNSDTLRFSWFYDWTGPLDDHVKSYTDVGNWVVIVPDTTEQSIKGSTWILNNQWPDIYNRLMNFVAGDPYGRVKLDGIIYVSQIGDNLPGHVMGMDRNLADLFKVLGITVKVKNAAGKPKKTKEKPREQMPRNMAQNMRQSENTGYTIKWGFNHHFAGPCEDHIARRTAQCGRTHLVPDSTFWSKVQQGQFGQNDWDYIASQFTVYQDEYGATFEGNLYPFVGRIKPETKQNLENLGFHVIETIERHDNRPAMPWNQAQEMLRSNSR